MPTVRASYGELVAAEVRAQAARKRVTGARLAAALDMSAMSMSRRLTGRQPFDVEELAVVADTLGVQVEQLLPRQWAPRGSNPQPTVSGVRHLALVQTEMETAA